ncbi:MAG TPA: sigma-54 dependent transcriptional regulator [Polyangiaceae bacterium]|nr:sigma-54 dependent transcriptional regulator [Polyangiaceae bacterium]
MHVVAGGESQRAIAAAASESDADERASPKSRTRSSTASWSKQQTDVACLRARGAHIAPVREFGRVVARSAAMHEVFDVLERFAKTDVTVTFCGETGVGKDILAHALHSQSARADAPLVVFDCGAVAANLAESELLGHERGAFTGAITAHAGAFERAHGGTLFLDEIAELPIDLQPRLLRALESRRVRRVGGRVDRRVDVRVIAATNRDLRADVAAGRFREDLFFRLAVAVVPIPPLRKRLEDLPQLVYGLLSDLGRPDLRVSDAAFTALRAHAWPGNIRELKNALACAVAFVEEAASTLEQRHLRLLSAGPDDDSGLDGLPLAGQALERIERVAIRQTLAQADGNKMYAARALGIAVSTLYEKLKKYGL